MRGEGGVGEHKRVEETLGEKKKRCAATSCRIANRIAPSLSLGHFFFDF